MFLPWRAEIPGGYRPWATLCLVATNVIVAAVVGFADHGDAAAMSWTVTRPDFDPIQWITASFVHVDAVHLIGNLFFLWSFGMVIEGVARADRFLALFCALALVSGAAQAHFGSESAGQGSSGITFGLMITAAICAPRIKIWVFIWYVVRAPRNADTTTVGLSLFYLVLIVLEIVAFGLHPGLAPLAVALVAGAVFALVMRRMLSSDGRRAERAS